VSDYFLIDTLSDGEDQPVAGYVGITGEVCDWEIAADLIMSSPIPVIVAGGISSANVYGAITRLRPAGVDSCTKTNALDREGNPIRFRKDMKKVRALLREARRADAFVNEGGK
jgi:phosphoribosylanthranilate isomerase